MRSAPISIVRALHATPLALLFMVFALCLAAPGFAQQARIIVQDSPLAGFRYHNATTVFEAMQQGDALALVREPENPHDVHAIRVEWRGAKLGYVPRAENQALAWALDRGERVRARVSRLTAHPNPRERIRFEVLVD